MHARLRAATGLILCRQSVIKPYTVVAVSQQAEGRTMFVEEWICKSYFLDFE